MKTRVTDEIEKVFRPEFINRVNDIIVFRHLNDEDMKHVVDLELSKVRERLRKRASTIELTDEAKEFLVKKGSNTDYGARPLRRAIETFVEDPLAEELLKGEFAGKDLDQDRGQEGRRQEAARVRRPLGEGPAGARAGRRRSARTAADGNGSNSERRRRMPELALRVD